MVPLFFFQTDICAFSLCIVWHCQHPFYALCVRRFLPASVSRKTFHLLQKAIAGLGQTAVIIRIDLRENKAMSFTIGLSFSDLPVIYLYTSLQGSALRKAQSLLAVIYHVWRKCFPANPRAATEGPRSSDVNYWGIQQVCCIMVHFFSFEMGNGPSHQTVLNYLFIFFNFEFI